MDVHRVHMRPFGMHTSKKKIERVSLDVERFPDQLQESSKIVKALRESLKAVPHFFDDAVVETLESFEDDLEVWFHCSFMIFWSLH
jgi:hypothetical protein